MQTDTYDRYQQWDVSELWPTANVTVSTGTAKQAAAAPITKGRIGVASLPTNFSHTAYIPCTAQSTGR